MRVWTCHAHDDGTNHQTSRGKIRNIRCLPVSWFTIRTTKKVFVLHLQDSQKVPRSPPCHALCFLLACHMPIEGIQEIRYIHIVFLYQTGKREIFWGLRVTTRWGHLAILTYEVQVAFSNPKGPYFWNAQWRRNINDTILHLCHPSPLKIGPKTNSATNLWIHSEQQALLKTHIAHENGMVTKRIVLFGFRPIFRDYLGFEEIEIKKSSPRLAYRISMASPPMFPAGRSLPWSEALWKLDAERRRRDRDPGNKHNADE